MKQTGVDCGLGTRFMEEKKGTCPRLWKSLNILVLLIFS